MPDSSDIMTVWNICNNRLHDVVLFSGESISLTDEQIQAVASGQLSAADLQNLVTQNQLNVSELQSAVSQGQVTTQVQNEDGIMQTITSDGRQVCA